MLQDTSLRQQSPLFWTPIQHLFWAEMLFFRAIEREPFLLRLSTDRAVWLKERVVPKIRLFLSDLASFDEKECYRYTVDCVKEHLLGRG